MFGLVLFVSIFLNCADCRPYSTAEERGNNCSSQRGSEREEGELESCYSTVTVYRKVEQANRIPPSSPGHKIFRAKGRGSNSQDLPTR